MQFGKYREEPMKYVFESDKAYTAWCLDEAETPPSFLLRRFIDYCRSRGRRPLGEEAVALATVTKPAAWVGRG